MKTWNLGSVILIAVVVSLALVGGLAAVSKISTPSSAAAADVPSSPAPTLVFEKSHVVRQNAGSVVMLMGSGYKPGQEIRLLISQSDGSLSDIGSTLEPEPKANAFGVWATKWTVREFASRSLAKDEVYILMATDESYNVLSTAPFGYYDDSKPYDKWPTWAQAVVAPPAPAKQ